MTIPEYDKEGWWKVCKDAKPELTREEFEARWHHLWFLARLTGQATRKPA